MRLLPREDKYFGMLNQLATQVRQGGELFVKIFEDYQNHARYGERIKGIEVSCDELAGRITQKLNSTFITPIDREDIMALASDLDNVLDMIDAAANRLQLYEIVEPSPAMIDLAEVIVEATSALQKAVGMIRNMKQADRVEAICVEVNRLENVADDLMNTSVAALFKEKDVIHIIKHKEIIERLEEATDYCEDVANVLSDIVAKNQ